MSVPNENDEAELGYRFVAGRNPQSIGYRRLEINILCAPSERHFDPKITQIPIFTLKDSVRPHKIDQLEIYHPWVYRDTYQVAPGLVTLADRKGKKVEAYTFGGKLTIDSDENCTTCVLQSDAPIIEINHANPAIMKFIDEVEIILAEQRANRAADLEDFEARLEKVPVSKLYVACLMELKKKIGGAQAGGDFVDRKLADIIDEERQFMRKEGSWPEKPPSFSEML
ncbi:MAG: hypothetical protein P8Z42_10170 [Anaerolineales bacterium]|jgi:hypothetical protein